ncbi:MAG: 5-methyltetrahydropteroyltriglutamate--homocysteine S-methyltransferase [Campylobacter sp.]|nr:5-methyltetrahydropteroyltriglutamate--homocysteine S-methyltransferase [Campylobacter sp.]
MLKTYVTGFSRIGEQRELKFALEKFWQKKDNLKSVESVANELRIRHHGYHKDAKIDIVSTNDFSFYDIVLDHIIAFNLIPKRFNDLSGETLYFAIARGDDKHPASEMTKWFNTNYHYIVPEISKDTKIKLNSTKFINELKFGLDCGVDAKFNLIGPITLLALSKSSDEKVPFDYLDDLTAQYCNLLKELSALKNDLIVQIEEPIFSTSAGENLLKFAKYTYTKLSNASSAKLLFTTYFEHSNEVISEVSRSGIWGVGLDFVHAKPSKEALTEIKNAGLVLFAGIIDGRNIWRSNLKEKLELTKSLQAEFGENLAIGTSCSLLHVPVTLKYEDNLDDELKSWLSFGVEKLEELKVLKELVNEQSKWAVAKFDENLAIFKNKKTSSRIHDKDVKNRVKNLNKFSRDMDYEERIKLQEKVLNLPILPTTTIGSFPQTAELRRIRNAYKKSLITKEDYENHIKEYIDDCVKFQEEIDLDVLVHGEPERNDMVEYFGEKLKGFAFTKNGWVQSYGSRCVKPPLLFADVSRPNPMTVDWISYAQSQTNRVMKGMLTGPVTILNWSFVRQDISRDEVATQLALCIADEVDDLQKAGIKIIQVDEAAFKEGYPLRVENRKFYENFAVESFKLSVSSALPTTQIHTHMCYSEFNDIIKTIEDMDADVISIETARSGNKLLKVFKRSGYKAQVGPGIYDIHSPRIPSVEEMVAQIDALLEVLPKERLWINPDCGLKTRKWEEVKPSLKNLVEATKISRL